MYKKNLHNEGYIMFLASGEVEQSVMVLFHALNHCHLNEKEGTKGTN
jgi:hypothetical protein